MPDNTPLGELDVVIGADWGDLESSINDAVAAAQAGAAAIADAFSDTSAFAAFASAIDGITASIYELDTGIASVGRSLADFSEASTEASSRAQDFAEASTTLGAAATNATESVQAFVIAENEAGQGGEEAGSGLSAFRGALLELGEGLAITEGLKELATDALDAYGSIQQATLSLTALTGSSEQADQMITDLIATAQQIPVATESLVSAAQRMTAFGLTAEQVTTLLADAANAAYATGASFDNVASRITNMAASGMAGARQLVTLGITADQLAATMNAMGLSVDATATTVSKAFKALDVDQRVAVLDESLQKFSGIAEESAATVKGAWQILGNTWTEVSREMGAELAPIATSVTGFLTTVAHDVEGAIQWFNSLPGPIQDVGIAAGVVLGASGPLIAGLGALSLTLIGIKTIPESLAAIGAALNLTGGAAAGATPPTVAFGVAETGVGAAGAEAAPGVEALASAEVIAGETATAATGELVGLGAVVATVADGVVVAGTAFAAWKLGEWWTENEGGKGGIDLLNAAVSASATAAVNAADSFAKWALGSWASSNATPATGALTLLDAAIAKLVNDIPGVSKALDAAANNLESLTKFQEDSLPLTEKQTTAEREYTAALTESVTGLHNYGDAGAGAQAATDKLYASIQKLHDNLDTANGVLENAKEDLDSAQASGVGLAGANEHVAAAQADVTKATNALNSALGVHKEKIDAVSESWKVLSQDEAAVYVETSALANSFAGQVQDAMNKAIDAQANAANEANVLAGVWLKLASSGTASADQQDAAWQKASQAANKAGIAIGTAINDAASQMGGISKNIDTAIASLERLAASGTATGAQVHEALVDVNTIAGSTGVSLQGVADKINAVSAATGGMAAVIQNGNISLVALGTAGQTAAIGVQKADDSALAFMTTSNYLSFLVPPVASGVASLGPAGQTAATGINAANQALSGLAQTAGTIHTSVVNTTDAITKESAAITIYASKVKDATTAETGHTTSLKNESTALYGMGVAATTATPYISQLTTVTMQGGQYAETGATAWNNAGLSLTKFGTVAGDAYHYATQLGGSMTDLNTISGAFAGTADTAAASTQLFGVNATNANGTTETLGVTIQGVTNDAGDFADGMNAAASDGATATGQLVTYWDNVAQAVDGATQAVADFGTQQGNFGNIDAGTSGKSGGSSFLDAYLGSNPTQISESLIGMQTVANALGFIYSNPVGYGGTVPGFGGPLFGDVKTGGPQSETGVATGQLAGSLNPLVESLHATKSATDGLTDALTGHSLAPALDTTAHSTDNLSSHMKTLADGVDTFGVTVSSVNGVLGVQEGAGNPVATSIGVLVGTLGNFGDTVDTVQEELNILNAEAIQNAIPGLGDLAETVTGLANEALVASTAIRSQTAAISSQQTETPSGTQVGADQVDTPMGNWYLSNGVWTLYPATYAVAGALGSGATAAASQTANTPGQTTSTPSGTQIAPGIIDSSAGQWTQGTDGVWTLHPFTSSTALQSSFQAGDAAASASANAAGSGLTAPPSGATQVSPSQYQSGQGAYYLVNGKWYLFSETSPGASFGNGGGGSAAFGSGSTPSSAAQVNLTMNVSGVTPSAANALMNTAINNLRLGARLNL